MGSPTLQKATAVSMILHIGFISLLLSSIRRREMPLPSPYIVSLVTPKPKARPQPKAKPKVQPVKKPAPPAPAIVPDPPKAAPVETAPPKKPAMSEKSTKKAAPTDSSAVERAYLKERLNLMRSKKSIQKAVGLRKIISLGKSKPQAKKPPQPLADDSQPAAPEGSFLDTYYAKVHDSIWLHWSYPNLSRTDLMAVVAITIEEDGSIKVTSIEETSGDPLFDDSALRAIQKASPISPPPFKLEMGIRFIL